MQPCGTDSLTLANRRIATAMKQGSHHFEWMHKRADTGETFPADVLLSAMELDGKRVLQAVVRDITARKRAEEDMRTSHEQYRALAARLEQIREEERTRIARGIHDELGQELTGLKMDLRWMEHGLEDLRDPRVSPLLEKTMAATDLVDTAIRTVQRIAADLRPAVLDKLGLVAAVRREASQFQQHSGIACRVTGPDVDPQLPEPAAIACFRIFQEAMTNLARHAAATAVEVDFQTPPDGFVLEVRDNGKGFSSGLAEKAESLGLLGMRERARALGGEVTVRPRAEGGTVVRLWIPKTGKT
jgi:signal transduction histidine kinase